MKVRFILKFLVFFLFINITGFTLAQEEKEKNMREDALNVFMDSFYLNMDYIRREIPYVNYVRDRKEADVHIMVTRRKSGSGGNEYSLAYIGQGDYDGMNENLVYNSAPDETTEVTRIGRSQVLQIGLMKYVARTSISKDIQFNFKNKEQQDEEIVEDKWKSWVFNIDISGNLRLEETQDRQEYRSSFSANKITPDWRIELLGRG